MNITLVDIFIFLVVFLLLLYYYGMKAFELFKNTDVKCIKPTLPFMGSMQTIFLRQEHMYEFMKRIYDTHPDEKYVGLFEGRKPLILIRDVELLKQIGIKSFDEFHDHRSFVADNANDIFANVLFIMTGEKWKEMRASLSPAFTSSKMRNMHIYIEECAKEMADYFMNTKEVKEKGLIEIDVKDTVSRYTNDVIANAVFGIKINSLEDRDNDFYKLGKLANDFSGTQILKFYGYIYLPWLMKFLNITLIRSNVSNFFQKIFKETMDYRSKNGVVRHDMINLLMEAKKGTLVHETVSKETQDTGFATVEESNIGKQEIKRKWNDVELAAQAFLFYLAGFETTSTLITFLFYEMVRNPDIQKKLQEEIDSCLKASKGKITYNDILSMKYLDMTISETLRMWPPLANLDRVCSKSFTLPPPNKYSNKTYTINPNEAIWIPTYGLMHDPQHFPDPEKFDPERFSDENKSSIDPITYLPFGIGPRNCIGSRFALLEMKLITFHMLSKFNIVPVQKTEIPVKLDKRVFQLKIVNGLYVGLKPR